MKNFLKVQQAVICPQIVNTKNECLTQTEIVDIGLKIVGCINLADGTFGGVLLKEISASLVNFAVNSYFICTIYTLFTGDEFHWITP